VINLLAWQYADIPTAEWGPAYSRVRVAAPMLQSRLAGSSLGYQPGLTDIPLVNPGQTAAHLLKVCVYAVRLYPFA
jgi:hypothetical protein